MRQYMDQVAFNNLGKGGKETVPVKYLGEKLHRDETPPHEASLKVFLPEKRGTINPVGKRFFFGKIFLLETGKSKKYLGGISYR